MKEDVDSIIYYDTASELEKIKGNDALSREYYDKSNTMADSVLIAGLNDRLRAVEKKYDTQQAELENAKLSLELRNTLLTLAAIVIGALALLLLVLRYRHRLREKENEYELLKADLNTSLVSLENMKSTVAQLESGHDNSNNTELKNILEEQIGAVHQLMKWSYELDSDTFVKKFNSLMTMPSGKEQESFWNNLHTITNELHDNVLTRAQEAAGGTLRDDEINYLALYCCGFSRSVIMTCMHYKSLGTVSNKKSKSPRSSTCQTSMNSLNQKVLTSYYKIFISLIILHVKQIAVSILNGERRAHLRQHHLLMQQLNL